MLVGAYCTSGAIVSVRDYGAAGDGLADDAAAIQTAIANSAAGDTVLFTSGVYRVTRTINIASNRTYQGQSATLKSSGGYWIFAAPWDAASNIAVDGLVFDGGSFSTNGISNPAADISITNCTFRNIVSANDNWTTHKGIVIPSGLNNGVIAHNQFANILTGGNTGPVDTDAGAIHAYRLSNVAITDNVFDNVNEAVYIKFDGAGPYPGVVIARNVGTRVHRMGIETQGSNTQGMLVENNQFSDFLNPFWNTFGLSIVVEGGYDTIVSNNTVDASPPAPPGSRYGVGIEIGGERTVATGNTVSHDFWAGIAIEGGSGSTITGNYLCGSAGAMKIIWEWGVRPQTQISGNTTAATCVLPTNSGGSKSRHPPARRYAAE
jgi:parallel beta-helix repeat protein